MKPLKKAVVILGAGASNAVSNSSVPLTSDATKYQPPLARELFSPKFWNLRQAYRGAQVVGAELGNPDIISGGAFDIEERLTTLANHPDPRNQRHFRDIPPYLRDVLMTSTQHYAGEPSNYINLARYLTQDQTHEILFVLLNYDSLLEAGLEKWDPALKIDTMDQYVESSRQARVVKIHGSIDWGIPIPFEFGSRLRTALNTFDPLTAGTATVLNKKYDATVSWHENGQRLYPRLTAPLKRKAFVCPESHTSAFRDFVASCHKFLVIGTSGLDEDLLRELAELTSGSGYHITYVGPDAKAVDSTQNNFEAAIKAFRAVGPAQPPVGRYDQGFNGFVSSSVQTQRFLSAD